MYNNYWWRNKIEILAQADPEYQQMVVCLKMFGPASPKGAAPRKLYGKVHWGDHIFHYTWSQITQNVPKGYYDCMMGLYCENTKRGVKNLKKGITNVNKGIQNLHSENIV